MLRRDFAKLCALLGISAPLHGVVSGCALAGDELPVKGKYAGKVLIIGAGAAGLTAGHLLAQNGVAFEVLEASGQIGGRMKQQVGFADFPLPLGAEWLHVAPDELDRIVNDSDRQHGVKTVEYDASDQLGHFEAGEYTTYTLSDPGKDRKFIGTTWFDFFDTHIAPSVVPHTRFNTVVESIDYSTSRIRITDQHGNQHVADKVIITAPLKMLQQDTIRFTPPLPSKKRNAIRGADVWGGFKAFLQFEQQFYPAMLSFKDSETHQGQRLYYDAAYGQASNHHVLGLFAVGAQAQPYQALPADEVINHILAELDAVFEGAASKYYLKHIIQNWSEEPHIHSAYLSDVASASTSTMLSTPENDRLYFAGEAYTRFNDWGSVHAAARSARDTVRQILLPA